MFWYVFKIYWYYLESSDISHFSSKTLQTIFSYIFCVFLQRTVEIWSYSRDIRFPFGSPPFAHHKFHILPTKCVPFSLKSFSSSICLIFFGFYFWLASMCSSQISYSLYQMCPIFFQFFFNDIFFWFDICWLLFLARFHVLITNFVFFLPNVCHFLEFLQSFLSSICLIFFGFYFWVTFITNLDLLQKMQYCHW